MKKSMILAAVMVMMLATAAPAFAQDVTVTTGNSTQYNAVGQNLIGTVGDISAIQAGSATAEAADDSVAVARVDQSQNVSLEQTNVVLNDFDGFVGIFDFFWWWF